MRFYLKLTVMLILGWVTVGGSASSAAAREELELAERRLAAVDCEGKGAFDANRTPSEEMEARRQEAWVRFNAASDRWLSH